jgi:NADH-quinone oxidoreductase subunit L
VLVNGTARLIGWSATLIRHLQSGYVYHYAFTMIIGVFVLLYWWGVR